MGTHLASELVETSNDLNSLRKPGFWVVLASFEGSGALQGLQRLSREIFQKVSLVGMQFLMVVGRAR